MESKKNVVVFIDLETGGLKWYPHRVPVKEGPPLMVEMSPITQVAAVAVDVNTGAFLEEIEVKVQFDPSQCDASALAINHYDEAVWKEKAVAPGFARGAIIDYLARHATVQKTGKSGRPYMVAALGGHNISGFDFPFLKAWYAEKFLAVDHHVLDTMLLANLASVMDDTIKFKSLRLVDVAEALNIVYTADAHDALADVKVTACVYVKLMAQLKSRMK